MKHFYHGKKPFWPYLLHVFSIFPSIQVLLVSWQSEKRPLWFWCNKIQVTYLCWFRWLFLYTAHSDHRYKWWVTSMLGQVLMQMKQTYLKSRQQELLHRAKKYPKIKNLELKDLFWEKSIPNEMWEVCKAFQSFWLFKQKLFKIAECPTAIDVTKLCLHASTNAIWNCRLSHSLLCSPVHRNSGRP